jgi:hypothetical protein
VTASSLESEQVARELWGAGPALAALAAARIRLVHGVDATALEASPLAGERFDRVLFTFPHGGAKGRIQVNRELLAGFARSLRASCALAPGGAAEVSLVAGQGGTPADGEALRAAGNSWQLGLQAAEGGLVLAAATPFDHDAWAACGYLSAGCWRGLGRQSSTREQGFRTAAAVVHTLLPQGAPGALAPWPERFIFDVSLWLAGSFWPDALAAGAVAPQAFADEVLRVARAAVGVDALAEASVVNVWRRPADGRLSFCVRLVYCAPARALSAAGALALHEAVREALPTVLPVQLRSRADALDAAAVLT